MLALRPKSRFEMITRDFVTRFERASQLSDTARGKAIAIWGEEYTRYLARQSPRNTNRYVRGWILAGNTAQVTTLPVPRVVPLSETERGAYIERLQRQLDQRQQRVDKLTRMFEAWYGRTGRKLGVYGRKLKRELGAAERSRDRAQAWLDRALAADSFIFFGASPKAKRRTETIREKVYGGEGYQKHTAGYSEIILHNLEPHCRILERRLGLVRSAKELATREMRRRMTAEYVEEV